MVEVELNADFQRLWRGRDPFEAAFALTGESFRAVKSRRTFRTELEGRGYFVKLHRGIGWREYWKNVLQCKSPVTDAGQEYRALRHLARIGVPSIPPCAYGCKGKTATRRISFLITAELAGAVSLEDFCRDWENTPPPFTLKTALTRALGEMTGKMHQSGLNHRDCYLCHFLVKKASLTKDAPEVHVIDLHRAQIRSRVPRHYLIKDLGGLWFSALDAGLTRHDVCRFLRAYFGMDLRTVFHEYRGLLAAVGRTARALYRKEHHREPPRQGGRAAAPRPGPGGRTTDRRPQVKNHP